MLGYLIAGGLGYLIGAAYRTSFTRRGNPIGGHMTKKQAEQDFEENILPAVYARYGIRDRVAISEAWNGYTDMLQKDGLISQKQYDTWTNPY